jgi:hypothetical protein
MNLQPYFESKLGQKIRVTRTTGHAFYTEVYRRQYELEVLAVDDGKVMFHVTSDDIVPRGYLLPRGYLHGGSDKQFGSVTVEIRDTLEATAKEAVETADPQFFSRYPAMKEVAA